MTRTDLDTTLTRLRRAFLVCHFLRWLPAGLLLPVLVLVLTERGLSLTEVGYVFAVYGSVTALLELPTGGLADSLGRKPVLLVATLFDAGFLVGLLLSQDLWQFMAAAVAGAIGRALLSGPLESWYVDTARQIDAEVELRPALSSAGVAESVAIGCGALLSTVLPRTATGLPLDGAVSLLTIPLLAGLLAHAASFLAVVALVRETERSAPSPSQTLAAIASVPATVRSGVKLAMSTRDVRLILGATFVLVVGVVSVEALWQPRFAELLGGSETAVRVNGYVIVGMSLVTAAGSWFANHLPTSISNRPATATAGALLLAAAALAGLAATDRFAAAVTAFLLLYAAIATGSVLSGEMLHERVPARRRATMLSTLSLSQQSGNLVSSLVLARLADTAGIPVAWFVGAGAVFIAAALMATITDTPRSHGR